MDLSQKQENEKQYFHVTQERSILLKEIVTNP